MKGNVEWLSRGQGRLVRRIEDEGRLEHILNELWGILYADDAGIALRFTGRLAKMMTVVVRMCIAFGLPVSKKKKKGTNCMRGLDQAIKTIKIEPAGHKAFAERRLGTTTRESVDLDVEIQRRIYLA